MKSFLRQNPPARIRVRFEFAAVVAVAAILLAGCAYTPPPTVIAPVLPEAVTVIERETALVLTVSDERAGAVDAAADGAVFAAIEAAVRELFARQGYRLVTADAPADARLNVAVRAFDYQVAGGRWSSEEEADAVFVADAARASSRRTSTYRSTGEREAAFELYKRLPGATPSDVLSDILARIASDAELQRFLTGAN